MSGRRNVVALLAHRAPELIGWLEIPLTPSRAARLADFCARAGIDAQALVLDLLDDVIFNTAPHRTCTADNPALWTGMSEVVSGGVVSCVEPTRSFPQSTAQSSARSCRALHDCAVLPSDEPAKASGLSKPLRSSPREPNAACEPPATSFQGSASHPADPSPQSSPKFQGGHCD